MRTFLLIAAAILAFGAHHDLRDEWRQCGGLRPWRRPRWMCRT